MTNIAEPNHFPWASLPKDVLLEIFRKLPISDIVKCKRISREFSRYLEDENVWKSLFYVHFTIDQNILGVMQKDTEFAFKKLFHTPKWDSRRSAHHPEIAITNKGKLHDNTKIGVVQSRQVYKAGIHYIQILVNDGGDSCVIGFSEKRFVVDASKPNGNMGSCVGNYACKNYGVTGWGTFWSCGDYTSNPKRRFHSGDIMTLVLNFEDNTLRYYRNNVFHTSFESISGHLYLTVTMRHLNKVTIIPCIPSIVKSQLVEETTESVTIKIDS